MVVPLMMKNGRQRRDGWESGFTFIEMIASLALLGLLASIFGMGLVAAVESYDFSRSNAQVAQKGQMAMARMTRELTELSRMVNVGAGPFIVYDRIEEVNGIPTTNRWGLLFDSAARQVRLYENLDDTDTTIDAGDTGDVLADSVAALSLRCFQGADEMLIWPFTAPVTIQITLSMDRPDSSAHTQDFTTLIHLRNNDNAGGALR